MRRSVADPGEEEEIEGGQDFQKIHFKNGKHLSLDFKKVEFFVQTSFSTNLIRVFLFKIMTVIK